ncbi:hypothetical protein KEJ23_06975, partial [Candidatus Bathyarchaeota archaeon]|nr:hypothetical protein [Candidatus Bathyarchaeota archaeon]
GAAVAYRLKAFKANLAYFDVLDRSNFADELHIKRVDLDHLLRESDI